jgi:hypothetical protein
VSGYDNGSNATIRLRTCNGSSGSAHTGDQCSAWVSEDTVTYGPIPQPSLDVTATGNNQCISWSYSGNANGKAVVIDLDMNGSNVTHATSGPKSYGDSGSRCNLGYKFTGNFTLTVNDSASAPGQSGARDGKTARKSATTEDPPPQPPTLTNLKVVPGGCCGQPGEVGIAWDTTYPPGSGGGTCDVSRDGARPNSQFGPLGCAGNGTASRQIYNEPLGSHTYCGWVTMPDGSKSNTLCKAITVTQRHSFYLSQRSLPELRLW